MKKVNYFSHDTNARSDPKILNFRSEFGWEGYGLFWALVEMMFESDDSKIKFAALKGISFSFNIDITLLRNVIDCCVREGLFASDEESFWSNGVVKRKRQMEEEACKKSKAGKKGMEARWGKSVNKQNDNDVITGDNSVITENNKIKENKIKEKKEKEIKEIKEIIISPNGDMSAAADSKGLHPVDYTNIMDFWNKHSKLKSITVMTEKRKSHINARVKEHGLEAVYKVIDNVSKSSFLRGNNSRGWTANFDWIILPNNFVKVLEGNYLDRDIKIRIEDEIERRAEALRSGAYDR